MDAIKAWTPKFMQILISYQWGLGYRNRRSEGFNLERIGLDQKCWKQGELSLEFVLGNGVRGVNVEG